MEIRELIIYLCIVLPMIPILFALRDKFARRFLLFSIIGLSICLVSAQINTILIEKLGMDEMNYSITISPINEEILKAIPLIMFTVLFPGAPYLPALSVRWGRKDISPDRVRRSE